MDATDPRIEVSAPFTAALADLRGSLKWLVASSGAAAAVLVAGLRLTSAKAGSPVWVVLVGLGAALVAIVVVLALLVSAARVLTLPRPTATDISNLEIETGVAYPASAIPPYKDLLVEWIQERRTYLLGDAKTVTELYSGQYINSLNALHELNDGKPARWRGQQIEPPGTDEQRAQIERVLESARIRLTGVEDAAHYFLTDDKYQKLFGRRFIRAAVVFVLAVFGFALTTVWPVPDMVTITKPLAVHVYVVDKARSPIPVTCDKQEFSGVQVGGSADEPTITLAPNGEECPAMKIESIDGLVVVPIVK